MIPVVVGVQDIPHRLVRNLLDVRQDLIEVPFKLIVDDDRALVGQIDGDIAPAAFNRIEVVSNLDQRQRRRRLQPAPLLREGRPRTPQSKRRKSNPKRDKRFHRAPSYRAPNNYCATATHFPELSFRANVSEPGSIAGSSWPRLRYQAYP